MGEHRTGAAQIQQQHFRQQRVYLSKPNSDTLALLYDSDAAPLGSDAVGTMAKFTPPMPINGKVYLPSNSCYLNVYGLGSFPAAPTCSVIGYR